MSCTYISLAKLVLKITEISLRSIVILSLRSMSFFPELVMSTDLLSFEHPRYFYFAFVLWNGNQITNFFSHVFRSLICILIVINALKSGEVCRVWGHSTIKFGLLWIHPCVNLAKILQFVQHLPTKLVMVWSCGAKFCRW